MTDDEVKIGLVYPDTGVFSEIFSAARAGYDARFGLENARGGVHGRFIDYEWRDDEGVPSNNLEAVQHLVEREGVLVVAEASTGTSGGAEYLAANNIPVVGIAAEEVWIHFRNMFAFTYVVTDGESVDTFGRFVRQQGGTKALVIGIREREQAGGGLGGQLATSLQAAGVEVDSASPFEYTPGASSAERLAQQLLENGIDTLVTTGTAADFAEVVAAARNAGVPLKAMLSSTAVDNEILDQFGASLAGLSFFSPHVPFQSDSPALAAYRDAMADYAPQLTETDQTLTLASYINADMVIRGLQEAGPCPTREAFADGLRGVADYTAGGLVPSTNFEEDFGRLKECYAFVRVNAAGSGLEVANPSLCGDRVAGPN